MRHNLLRSLLMHTPQPSPTRHNPNPLPKKEENKQRQIIRQQHTHKNPPNNNRIPTQQDPIQQVQPHPKTNRLFPQIHRYQHLARIRRIAVHSIGQREREVEKGRPVDHCDAGEVAEPVEIALRGHAVDEEAGGSNQHRYEEDAEAHFGLADVVVFAG